jgi:CRISPR-associated protein Cas1
MNNDNNNNEDVPDLLPVRMLNEFSFCERLFYLEWVQGNFEDSADTIEGRKAHRNVDKISGNLPETDSLEPDEEFQVTSVLLSGSKSGLISRLDLIEVSNGYVSPVEYKKGTPSNSGDGVWYSDRIQICAQAIILEENGYSCKEGVVYYSSSKKRIVVPITKELIGETLELRGKALLLARSGKIPSPLVDSPKCPGCSLVGICLPDETNSFTDKNIYGSIDEPRRLYPARDDALPVYIQDQGAYVSKKNEELVIKIRDKPVESVRLMNVSQLSLFGNVQISTQSVHELCKRGIPINYFSYGGWFYGFTQGMGHKNVELRDKQYSASKDAAFSLNISKNIVDGKIRNSRTLLRRNSKVPVDNALKEMQKWINSIKNASNFQELLGIEGMAARTYFMHFNDMLKTRNDGYRFDFESRNRRPPRDPVNSMLSYVYSMLVKDFTITLLATGFDPFLGFYHRPRYGRPALALDMMEEFRSVIGDSTVISMINNGEINESDFIERSNSVTTKPDGRKKIIGAYERRMDSLVTHPLFGYQISYRRVLEVQARLLGRFLSGEIETFPTFLIR